MSSGAHDPSHQSRKRPIDSSGGGDYGGRDGICSLRGSNRSGTLNDDTTRDRAAVTQQARDYKRRQINIMQKSSSWGFREVLAECGLLEFVAFTGASSASLAAAAADDEHENDNINDNDDGGEFKKKFDFWCHVGGHLTWQPLFFIGLF